MLNFRELHAVRAERVLADPITRLILRGFRECFPIHPEANLPGVNDIMLSPGDVPAFVFRMPIYFPWQSFCFQAAGKKDQDLVCRSTLSLESPRYFFPSTNLNERSYAYLQSAHRDCCPASSAYTCRELFLPRGHQYFLGG